MKILNLYAGIGGNRKLWTSENLGFDMEITAVELNEDIAKIYQDFFPDDTVLVEDAHEYLLNNFKNYDFIWSSPPCPSHSKLRYAQKNKWKAIYPDMKLYEEIILLKHYLENKFVIENVRSYYDPLIKPQEIGRHYYWSNFHIHNIGNVNKQKIANLPEGYNTLNYRAELIGIKIENFYNYKGDKRQLIANCVEPAHGLHILNCAYNSNTLF